MYTSWYVFFTDSKLPVYANACSLPYHSATSAFLKLPFPASKAQPKKTKSCGSLLTSQSNLEQLKLKEKEKEEKRRVPEEKRLEREQRKIEKANLKKGKADFTPKEIELFTTRFDNGYDLKHDTRYNLWLKINHPHCSSGSGEYLCH